MLGTEWKKSSRSGAAGHCVEARYVDGQVEVRNSNRPEQGSLAFTRDEWSAFEGGAADGEFGLPPAV